MKIKIVNIKKFIRSILLFLAIILILSLIIVKATLSHEEISYKSIYVSNGDTLWSIAKHEQKNNSYYTKKEIRYIIDDVINKNNLNSNNLLVNQVLKIPFI